MTKNFHLVLSVFLALSSAQQETKRYRSDYVYNSKVDAFYKLHTEFASHYHAMDICDMEGAQLMVITSDLDIKQLHSMFKKYPDLGRYVWVGDDGLKHESAEEEVINADLTSYYDEDAKECEVVTRKGEVESLHCYVRAPFICKVNAMNVTYNAQCNVFGKDYIFNETVGSCYRLSKNPMTWNQGYDSCRAEGAHLVVLNSAAEHQVVWDLMKAAPKVTLARVHWFYFVGFRADRPVGNENRVFRTIFNQTLDEAGYNSWSPGEPNNFANDEYCGSLFKNDGKFNDLKCSHEFGVICESEVPKHGTS